MTYEKATDIMRFLIYTIVASVLIVALPHVKVWMNAGDKIALHSDQFVGRGAEAMARLEAASRKLDDAATQSEGASKESVARIKELKQTLSDVDGLVKEARTQTQKIGGAATSSLQNFDTQVKAITGSTTTVLNSIPPLFSDVSATLGEVDVTLMGAHDTLNSLTKLVDGPITQSVANVNSALVPAGLLLGDIQTKTHSWLYPSPYNGKFKRLHLVWSLTNRLLPLTEPAYYLVVTTNELRR